MPDCQTPADPTAPALNDLPPVDLLRGKLRAYADASYGADGWHHVSLIVCRAYPSAGSDIVTALNPIATAGAGA